MTKLNKDEIDSILAEASKLENKLGWLQEASLEVQGSYNLPDPTDLIQAQNKVGYAIEDIETCVANIDYEIADCLNKIERLRKLLNA